MNMLISLVVNQGQRLPNILVFLCIIRNCLIVIDLLLKRRFKKSFVVGKESSFLLEDG
jgi:hypothetical protein